MTPKAARNAPEREILYTHTHTPLPHMATETCVHTTRRARAHVHMHMHAQQPRTRTTAIYIYFTYHGISLGRRMNHAHADAIEVGRSPNTPQAANPEAPTNIR